MSKKIKVLIVQGYAFQKGGVITFLEYLLNYIDKSKFTPVLLFLSEGELIDKFRKKEVIVKVIHSGRLRNIMKFVLTVFKIATLIKKEKIQVVFSNCLREHLYGGLAAWFTRKPSTFYWHGFAPSTVFDKAISLIPAKMIFANSKHTMTKLPKWLIPHTMFVYHGVKVSPQIPYKFQLRNKLKLPLNAPIITMVGVFMEWKGQEYFIRAVPKVLDTFPTAKFLLVGDISFPQHKIYADRLKELVKNMRLGKAVIFMGYREDVLDIMGASDIIVHASISPEPFGYVIIEAMSVATPVVATNIGGPCEIIESGKEGILVAPRNPDAIANECIKLLENTELRSKMGRYGREKVEKYFKAERTNKEIEKTWVEIVKRRNIVPNFICQQNW